MTYQGTVKFAKDASNGLSYEKMIYHIDKTHPRVSVRDKNSKNWKFKTYSWKKQIRKAPGI